MCILINQKTCIVVYSYPDLILKWWYTEQQYPDELPVYQVQNTAPIHLPACNILVSNPEWHRIRIGHCQTFHKTCRIPDECVHIDGGHGKPRTRKSPKIVKKKSRRSKVKIAKNSGSSSSNPLLIHFQKVWQNRQFALLMLRDAVTKVCSSPSRFAYPTAARASFEMFSYYDDEVLTLLFP